jgi:hypothetical protein
MLGATALGELSSSPKGFESREGTVRISRVLVLLVFSAAAFAQSSPVIIRPKEVHDVLVNPGIGIQTFQRFRGQAIYPTLRWSEVGPEAAVADATGPVDFPESSVAYLRWFWWQLEPEQGKYRWNILDSALEEGRKHGQTVNIRLMPYDQGNPLPEWYRNSGARRANKASDKDGAIWSPDSDDPAYFKHWSALVLEAGRRYDGHPWLDTVDISTVGYWGEGWGPYLPAWEVQKALIDVFFKAFTKTPLLMNFDEFDALVYGCSRGAGWRLDCWGDMGRPGRNWSHMFDMYPQQIARGGLEDVWRKAPVSLEVCGTPGSWKQWGFDLKPIFDQALRWHASTVNLKSTKIPDEWKADFVEFQKKLGYRYTLRRIEYPQRVQAGTMAPVKMWWFNAGIAPVYRDYELALRIGQAKIPVPVDIRRWLPGDAVFEGTLYVDDAITAGSHKLSVAMLDRRTGKPAIQLAQEGRQPDGWYDLGTIVVE